MYVYRRAVAYTHFFSTNISVVFVICQALLWILILIYLIPKLYDVKNYYCP